MSKALAFGLQCGDAAGFYILTVIFEGTTVYKSKVHVLWVGHPKEPEPFLAFTCDDPDLVAQSLLAYEGKPLDLEFELPK